MVSHAISGQTEVQCCLQQEQCMQAWTCNHILTMCKHLLYELLAALDEQDVPKVATEFITQVTN